MGSAVDGVLANPHQRCEFGIRFRAYGSVDRVFG